MNFKILFALSLFLFLPMQSYAQTIVVNNFWQEGNKVHIKYTISGGNPKNTYDISVYGYKFPDKSQMQVPT